MANESFQKINKFDESGKSKAELIAEFIGNIRTCPCCNKNSISGMAGSIHATCKLCGYKDPCCYD